MVEGLILQDLNIVTTQLDKMYNKGQVIFIHFKAEMLRIMSLIISSGFTPVFIHRYISEQLRHSKETAQNARACLNPHTCRVQSHTDREVTCCWEWALGRSLWGWAPTSVLGTSGDV